MTTPVIPPFFSSSILENYPVLSTAGPAPGIPLVVQLLDRVVWLPYSTYGLAGDDAPWGQVAINLAIASPFAGRVSCVAGQYKFLSLAGPLGLGAIELPGYNLEFEGQGYETVFNMTVGGIAVYCHGNVSLLPGSTYKVQGNGTKLGRFVVDGSLVASNLISTGLDVGDAPDLRLDFPIIQNFTATGTTTSTGANPLGAVGFNNCNRVTWTEKMTGDVVVQNCLNAVQYTTVGAADSTSHMYQDMRYHINLQPRQNMWVIARQGHVMNGDIGFYGNMLTDNSANTASAIVLGVGNQQGHIQREHIKIKIETDGPSGGSTLPFTITFGTNADNVIQGCDGYMRFLDGFQSSNYSLTNLAPFVFFGPIVGDSVLSNVTDHAQTGFADLAVGMPKVSAQGFYDGAGGIFVNSGDYFKFQLTGNTTINLAPDPNPGTVPGGGFAGNRHLIILIQQSGGGGNTVAWPHPGSPTLANPTVLWPGGGSGPTMTATANHWDKYELHTTDGITYFATATQNLFP